MDESKIRETQQELFEEFSSSPKKPERLQRLSRAQKPILFSTNTEQLLMAGILFILALCGVFFLGVMRGKALSGPLMATREAVSEPLSVSDLPAPVTGARPPAPKAPVVVPAAKATAPAIPVRTMPSKAKILLEASTKPYTIQIVTHRKKELAEQEMNGLRAQNIYSFIIPSGEYFQVCAGQYASKEEAKKDLARFQAKFKDCFLRRR